MYRKLQISRNLSQNVKEPQLRKKKNKNRFKNV